MVFGADVSAALLGLATMMAKVAWEEIWFRGIAFHVGAAAVGTLLLSVASFLAIHVPMSATHAAVVIAIGLVLGALRLGGLSLLSLTAIHASINLVLTLAKPVPALIIGSSVAASLAAIVSIAALKKWENGSCPSASS
jgi:hypothetical protein